MHAFQIQVCGTELFYETVRFFLSWRRLTQNAFGFRYWKSKPDTGRLSDVLIRR